MTYSKKLFISELYQEHVRESGALLWDRVVYFEDENIYWIELNLTH